MIKINCPKCLKEYNLPDEAIGKNGKCSCGETFEVNIGGSQNTGKNKGGNVGKDFFMGFGIVLGLVLIFAFVGGILGRLFGIPVLIFDVINFIVILYLCFNKYKEKRNYFIVGMIVSFMVLRIAVSMLLGDQEGKLRDTLRISGLKSIESQAEAYYMDNNKYPELEDLALPADPSNGKTIDGCKFVIKYEKISDEKYKVSACMEDRKDLAKADGGTDDLKLESGNFK